MIEELFTLLSEGMSASFGIALAASFAWGLASILLSPCHLASIPLIVGYIVRQGSVTARRSVGISLVFAAGILATIALVGLVTALLGRILGDVGITGNLLVAAVFVVAGLSLMDVVSLSWNPIPLHPIRGRVLAGALALGLVFGVGLGPCTFAFLAPVLGAVFSIATSNTFLAVMLIGAFGMGHCSVIVAAGSLAHVAQRYLDWTGRSRGAVWLRRGAGLLVLLAGVHSLLNVF